MQTYIMLNSSHDRRVLRHELGHALQFYAGDSNRTLGAFYKLIGLPGTVDDYFSLGPEWFADAFARATLNDPTYPGEHPPFPVPFPPAEKLLALFHSLPLSTTVVVAPTIEWFGPAAPGNFALGRSGNPVSLIVDHWIGTGDFFQAIDHFKAPGTGVSAHYVVSTTGRIGQVVLDEDTAYHANDFPVNQRSIGIEHQATPNLLPSDALYDASAWLHKQIAEKYQLTLEVGVTVRPHRDFSNTACPGTLDLDEIVNRAEEDMFTQDDRDRLKRIEDKLNPFTQNVPETWLRRLFYGFDPFTKVRTPNPTTAPPPLDLK